MQVYAVTLQLLPCLSSLSAGANDGEWLTTTVFFCWGMYNHWFFFAGMIRNGSCLIQYQQIVKGTSVQIWRYLELLSYHGDLLYCQVSLRVIMKCT